MSETPKTILLKRGAIENLPNLLYGEPAIATNNAGESFLFIGKGQDTPPQLLSNVIVSENAPNFTRNNLIWFDTKVSEFKKFVGVSWVTITIIDDDEVSDASTWSSEKIRREAIKHSLLF